MRPNLNNVYEKQRRSKTWDRLRESEKNEILKICNELSNAQVDHEEAELQKVWMKIGCIINNELEGYDEAKTLMWLQSWKRKYKLIGKFQTSKERDDYLDSKLEKIFGKNGYPSEWVDSLENG